MVRMLSSQYAVAFVHLFCLGFPRLYLLPLFPPFGTPPLIFPAFVESEEAWQDTTDNRFNLVRGGDVEIVGQLFSFAPKYLCVTQVYAVAGI